MFVVKNDPRYNAFKVIAGEMFNREQSINHFVNGVARTELPAEGYSGYPSFTTATRKYTLKARAGFIYLPSRIDLEWFVETIKKVIGDMGFEERLDGQPITTNCSHRMGANYCTNVIMEAKDIRAFSIGDGKTVGDNVAGSYRFLWQVRHISTINTAVIGMQPDLTIQRLAGIFWDADDITVHPHGTLTFEFSDDSFKYSDRAVKESVILFNNPSNPLMFELSEYWSEASSGTDAKEFMRNINLNKLVAADISQVEVKPQRIDDDSPAMSTEICFRCKEPLYGEVYGLAGHVSKQDEPIVVNGKIIVTPICPLCMHTTPEDSPIEQKYVRTLRLNWNRTALDMIDRKDFDGDKADICREVLKQIKPMKVKIDDVDFVFYLIGEKYVGFVNKDAYKFTKLVNAPFLEGRKFCKVTMVA
jgi:hypothetical protein